VVQRGECLRAIAERQLGAGTSPAQTAAYVQELWDRNAAAIHTGDPNLIYAGQRLELPK
jgi:nucleoid-associated protein YgaU